jgi:hypothetical protein
MPSLYADNFVENFKTHYNSLERKNCDSKKNKLNKIKIEAFDVSILNSHCECSGHIRYLFNQASDYVTNFGL